MIRRVSRLGGAIILVCLAGCSAAAGSAPPAQPASVARTAAAPAENPVAAAVSAEQAERGRVAFRNSCVECHGSNDFRGQSFLFRWGRRTAWDFFQNIRQNMPESMPGSLPEAVYVDLVAYVLTLNGYAAGGAELLPAEEVLGRLPMDGGQRDPALHGPADGR